MLSCVENRLNYENDEMICRGLFRVHCSADGAPALALERGTTAATDIGRTAVAMINGNGNGDIDQQKRIAYIIEGGDAEHHITHATHGGKTGKIHHCLAKGKQTAHLVDNGNGNDDDCPHRGDKHAKKGGQREGVERRMEIEVLPLHSGKVLYARVECGGNGNSNGKQRGIERRDVVEVNDVALPTHEGTDDNDTNDGNDKDEEDEQMGVGKRGDED